MRETGKQGHFNMGNCLLRNPQRKETSPAATTTVNPYIADRSETPRKTGPNPDHHDLTTIVVAPSSTVNRDRDDENQPPDDDTGYCTERTLRPLDAAHKKALLSKTTTPRRRSPPPSKNATPVKDLNAPSKTASAKTTTSQEGTPRHRRCSSLHWCPCENQAPPARSGRRRLNCSQKKKTFS